MLTERLASLGITGHNFKNVPETPRATRHYGIEGFKQSTMVSRGLKKALYTVSKGFRKVLWAATMDTIIV